MNPLTQSLLDAAAQSCAAVRDEVSNVLYDMQHASWCFDWRGARYRVPDTMDSPLASPSSEHMRAWIVRQILDRKHREVQP